MTEPDDFAITDAMIRLGGSFVRRLGELWRVADIDNRRRLRAAFPEFWAEYTAMAANTGADPHEG